MAREQIWKYADKEQIREFILSLKLLPAKSRAQMSEEKQLSLLYALSNQAHRHYHMARLPKRDGGSRRLLVPDPLLKSVQRNILHHCLDGREVSSYAYAYRRGLGLKEHAAVHAAAGAAGGRRERGRQILKLDIRNFFDNILFPRVYAFAFPAQLFPPAAAGLLAHLCCYYDRLPQGAPTSPAISNLVMKPFDESMGSWCGQRGILYTRYCDDLIFSGEFDAKAVYWKTKHFLEDIGFELNDAKTRLLHDGMRQTVTGIVVNEKPQVPASYRRKLRQEIYYCMEHGVFAHLERLWGRAPLPEEEEAYMQAVQGRISYVLQINPQDEAFGAYRREWAAAMEAAAGKAGDTGTGEERA